MIVNKTSSIDDLNIPVQIFQSWTPPVVNALKYIACFAKMT